MSDFEKEHWNTLNKREQYLLTELAKLIGTKSVLGKVYMEAIAMCIVKERQLKRTALTKVRKQKAVVRADAILAMGSGR